MTVEVTRGSRAGAAYPAPVTPAGPFTIVDNDGNVLLIAHNAGGAPASITITATATLAGTSFPDDVVSIAAGATVVLGPYPPVIFNATDDSLSGDAEAGITLVALGV